MGYYIDFEKIDLNDYIKMLKSSDLIPSRMILLDNIEKNFELIRNHNVKNISALINEVKTKSKLKEFSVKSKVDEEYLTILLREIKGYLQKPNRFSDFPNMKKGIIEKLEGQGIKNTLQLYDKILTKEGREQLAQMTNIAVADVLMLAKLTDLSRIRWVNHTFAYVLMESGYDTAAKVADADYEELYVTIKKLNHERQIYKGNIGVHDIQMCVEAARQVPQDIEF